MYRPENQYRCTIIRGKSQTEMEDLLPLYANIVHKYCPCCEDAFRRSAYSDLSYALFHANGYDSLSENNQKTVKNHYTEIMGTLLGLFYPEYDADSQETIVHESESCRYLVEHSDFPTFFKNLCLNFQFPNGEKKVYAIEEEINLGIKIKPFCYVIKLLLIAQSNNQILFKQEIGYYVLNNLDALRGRVSPQEVYERIMLDRQNGIRRPRLQGPRDWQHIKEQFNLLELADLIESDAERVWLNRSENNTIEIFTKNILTPFFNVDSYDLSTRDGRKLIIKDWKKYNGQFHTELIEIPIPSPSIPDRNQLIVSRAAVKSTIDLGDEGEAFVFKLEQERVRAFKERLVNKVLLLGKTKGLGYDIASIEADENPSDPEFARYIEVKTTKRTTRPSFNQQWTDTLNITRKEWIAAKQFGKAYNIYRVYFTKNETIVVRINNPYELAKEELIEVVPTVYQLDFGAEVVQVRYPV